MPSGRRRKLLNQARENRIAPTGAEARLYISLKEFDMGRVRRQIDAGNLIVDIGLPRRNLLIEVDGPSHDEKFEQDIRRDAWLRAAGFRILRVTNEEIFGEIESVIKNIQKFEESDWNQTCFNKALKVARQKSDLTHTPQPPSP
jgi:very-short-patch-repair endonuclease